MKTVKGRILEVGQKVFVYYNLHKHCFSVKDVKTGLVVAHTEDITLEKAQFKVSQAGRERVLREQKKNVHAGVIGYYNPTRLTVESAHQATYNPYKYESFVEKANLERIDLAKAVRLLNKKIYFQAY